LRGLAGWLPDKLVVDIGVVDVCWEELQLLFIEEERDVDVSEENCLVCMQQADSCPASPAALEVDVANGGGLAFEVAAQGNADVVGRS
jgi:hypothetical protein